MNFEITRKNGLKLRGNIMTPQKNPKAIIIYSNCFTCRMDYTINRRLSECLVNNGFSVIRYDYYGNGKSDGNFEEIIYENQVEDLNLVFEYVKKNFEEEIIMLGHSLGAITSLICAEHLNVDYLVRIAAPHTFEGLKNRLSKYKALYETQNHYVILVGPEEVTIRKDYVSMTLDSEYDEILKRYKGKSISFHSPSDNIAPYVKARLFNKIRHGLDLLIDYDGDHMFSKRENQYSIAEKINNWYEKNTV